VVNNTNEAFRFVQSRPHPLALYLFTQNSKVERKFITELQFGGGCVNDTISHLAAHNLPFGGVGNSGMGAYHGKNSFLTFTHQKAIVKRGLWLDPALRYLPYTPTKNQLIKKFLQ
jgi:aldehyde dehydrogenase (NAD+)